MSFDVVLPSVVSAITIATVFLYGRVEAKIKSLFEEKEFSIRDTVFLIAAMGVMLTIIVLVPQQAISVLFLMVYSFILFLFTYVAVEKWYLAVLPPVVFVVLYAFFWNLALLNIFAVVFAISVSLYLGGLFTWTTLLVFAGLITLYDFVQVFITGLMGASADKLVDLRLPILIEVPTFPFEGAIRLGLGDIFLTSLLAIQTAKKYGRKAGIISAISVGIAFFIFEVAVFSLKYEGYFPATLVVVGGWLLGLGIHRLLKWERPS